MTSEIYPSLSELDGLLLALRNTYGAYKYNPSQIKLDRIRMLAKAIGELQL